MQAHQLKFAYRLLEEENRKLRQVIHTIIDLGGHASSEDLKQMAQTALKEIDNNEELQ